MASFAPYQEVHFLSCTHGSERKCTRVKHLGKLKEEWRSFDDYLKIAFLYPRTPSSHQVILLWYPVIPLDHQVILLWHPRIPPSHQVILLWYPRIPLGRQVILLRYFRTPSGRQVTLLWYPRILHAMQG